MNTLDRSTEIKDHKVVSEPEWIVARQGLLEKEKEWTRAKDALSQHRRQLPWVRVEKSYIFEGPKGKESLAELFDRRGQLIVYHFMLVQGWEEGCSGCSFLSDHVDGMLPHLEHHDVSLVMVSRAPLSEIEAFKKRMGWKFKWVSSFGNEFNYDYEVSYKQENLDKGNVFHNYTTQKLTTEEQPGISVFYKSESGQIFHTYSAYERGLDILVGTYNYLDLTPKGRNESSPMEWMKLHDTYDDESASKST